MADRKLQKHLWYMANIYNQRLSANNKNAIIRIEIITTYGSKCQCCNEIEPKFLSIDHINNDGAQHRKQVGSGSRLYKWLKKNNFPKDNFQLLCHNCNLSKGSFGICPHQNIIDGPEKLIGSKLRGKRRARKLRLKIVNEYGNKCVCCNEDEPYFLTIDHINGNGKTHRAIIGNGSKFYKWLEHQGFPKEEYQLMCMNCNKAKGSYGECPHKELK